MKTEERGEGTQVPAPAALVEAERESRSLWFPMVIGVSGVAAVVVGFAGAARDSLDGALGWLLAGLVATTVLGGIAHGEASRRRLERLLEVERYQVSQLLEKDQHRFDQVAQITHQLKTPLTSLLGYARIIRQRASSLPDDQREQFLEIMENEGQRILQMIREMLESSRMEHVAAVQRLPLDLLAIAEQVVTETAAPQGRRVEVAIPAGDLGLYGDPAAMHHILTNLLDNALKYSPGGEPVTIAVTEGDSELLLTVRDRGQGIPAKELPFIFDRYRQASDGRGAGSVGLGLYIVRNLVEAHGGRVAVESTQGRGTTFTVALPRRRRDGAE